MYIDTHCHYNDEKYDEDLDEVLEKVRNAGVGILVNVGYDYKSSCKAIDIAKKYDQFCVIGYHPFDAETFDLSKLEKLYLDNKECNKIVGIGEIGLDYSREEVNKNLQKEVFISQIKFAIKNNLPIIIHSRDAALDTYEIIKDNVPKKYKLLFHCFAPTDDLTRLVINNDFYIACGGNITYKRNASFKKYIDMVPIDRIVLETDCPYLSPEPYRGKRNDSSNLGIINCKLAEYKNVDKEEMERITTENAIRFFGINR